MILVLHFFLVEHVHRKKYRHVNLSDLIKCQKNGPNFINYSTNYVSPNSWNMINYLLKQNSRKNDEL